MTPEDAFRLLASVGGTVLAFLFTSNIYFVKRLIDKLDNTVVKITKIETDVAILMDRDARKGNG